MRDYYDNRFHGEPLTPDDHVRVPTAIAGFDHQFAPEGEPPREWFERLYDIRRFTPMPRGGHFAPSKQPGLVAADIAAFFATHRSREAAGRLSLDVISVPAGRWLEITRLV